MRTAGRLGAVAVAVHDFDLSKYRAISLGAIKRPGNQALGRALEAAPRHGR